MLPVTRRLSIPNYDPAYIRWQMVALCGMAPVTRQFGKMRTVHRRLQCDGFTRQTFHEWANESWKFSKWARAFNVPDVIAKLSAKNSFFIFQRCHGKKHSDSELIRPSGWP